MMHNINHHLSQSTLMAYAAGTISEHMSLVIATHLAMCPTCRHAYEELEAVGGAELNSNEGMAISNNALHDVMALIDQAPILKPKPVRRADIANDQDPELPQPLRQFLPDGIDGIVWKNMAPGIKYYPLEGVKAGSGTVRLLQIAPGVHIPEHGHGGTELTLILRGSFSDEIGRFKPGDIADLDDENEHQPIADTHEPCICLIATDAPLKFKSLLPKVVQYFVGM